MKTRHLTLSSPGTKAAQRWVRIVLTAIAQFALIYAVVHTLIMSLGFYELSSFIAGITAGIVLGAVLGAAANRVLPDWKYIRLRLCAASVCVCFLVLAISAALFYTFVYHIELYDTAWYLLFDLFPQMVLVPMAFPGTLAFCLVCISGIFRKNR